MVTDCVPDGVNDWNGLHLYIPVELVREGRAGSGLGSMAQTPSHETFSRVTLPRIPAADATSAQTASSRPIAFSMEFTGTVKLQH